MSEGLHKLPVYVNDATSGVFASSLLFAVYMIVTLGLYYNNIRRTGQGDIFQCMAVGGFVTALMAIVLWMIPGMVSGAVLMIVIVIASLSVLLLFFAGE